MSSLNPFSRLRILRTRTVLLALPAVIVILYLSGPYHGRHFQWHTGPKSLSSSGRSRGDAAVASSSRWDEEATQRNACWVQWFSTGSVCDHPPQQWSRQDKLDLIWTWSNTTYDGISPSAAKSEPKPTSFENQQARAHAASSDLLRYSLRSAQSHLRTGFGSVTLLTPDVPIHAEERLDVKEECKHVYQNRQHQISIGQRPCWLAAVDTVYEPPELVHHRELACTDSTRRTNTVCSEAHLEGPDPYTTALLAAQAPGLSDTRITVSPHHMFVRPVSSSDFWSPLYGPTFRLTDDVTPEDHLPTSESQGQSNAPLRRVSELLEHRFGTRQRRKLLDVPQPVSASLIDEMQKIWPKELSLESTVAAGEQVHIESLLAHYTYDKYREALLWSFIVAKHDRDGDGVFSFKEARALLRDIGATVTPGGIEFPAIKFPIRSSNSLDALTESLRRAGLPARLAEETMLTSMDGLTMLSLPSTVESSVPTEDSSTTFCRLEPGCVEPLLLSLSPEHALEGRPSASDMLKRVAFNMAPCGDCILMHLVAKSGLQGLSAFLPSPDLEMSPIETLPLTPGLEDADYSLKSSPGLRLVKRIDVVSNLLSRYAHNFVLQDGSVAPKMRNLLETQFAFANLTNVNTSTVFSFKQHGHVSDISNSNNEDTWIWTKYARGWLSLRFPFAMRFETRTEEL